jgi:hypothetical protein
MVPSVRETALVSLLAALQNWPDLSDAKVVRNEPETTEIPTGGLLVLRDGDPGEPEVYLSPLQYAYSHTAELVVQVAGADSAGRDLDADALLQAIGECLDADPTLGGAVEMVSPGTPENDVEGIEGAASVKGFFVPVILEYVSSTPLG